MITRSKIIHKNILNQDYHDYIFVCFLFLNMQLMCEVCVLSFYQKLRRDAPSHVRSTYQSRVSMFLFLFLFCFILVFCFCFCFCFQPRNRVPGNLHPGIPEWLRIRYVFVKTDWVCHIWCKF